MIQALGLKKRLEHTHCQSAVVGISGGLDSTLALLVTAKAFDMLGISRDHRFLESRYHALERQTEQYTNACEMTRKTGRCLKRSRYQKCRTSHFSDIGQDFKT